MLFSQWNLNICEQWTARYSYICPLQTVRVLGPGTIPQRKWPALPPISTYSRGNCGAHWNGDIGTGTNTADTHSNTESRRNTEKPHTDTYIQPEVVWFSQIYVKTFSKPLRCKYIWSNTLFVAHSTGSIPSAQHLKYFVWLDHIITSKMVTYMTARKTGTLYVRLNFIKYWCRATLYIFDFQTFFTESGLHL